MDYTERHITKIAREAAKLFNAVHKAQVSWRRIKPLMQPVQPLPELPPRKAVLI